MKCPGCGADIPDRARFCPKCGLRQKYIPEDPLNGARIADRYLILELIGEGGSGKVYMARDIRKGQRVALKILHKELVGDAAAVLRFRREAQAVQDLENPHIIKILELGETHDRLPFIAMEYLEGETLASRLSNVKRMSFDTALTIILQVLEGLMEAHAMGLVHRDLRPRNIMLASCCDQKDFVKILDFGVAKILPTGGDPSKSFIGFVMGDATYTAPEQLLGKTVSAATDIYSAAIIFYQLLTGNPPYTGRTVMDIMAAHIKRPYPPLEGWVAGVPQGFDAVLSKALAKKPEDRFQTAYQFREALEGLISKNQPAPVTKKSKQPEYLPEEDEKYYNLQAPFRGEEGAAFRVPGGGVVRMPHGHKPAPDKFVYLDQSPVKELYDSLEEAWEEEPSSVPSDELIKQWEEGKRRERLIWLAFLGGVLLIFLGGYLLMQLLFSGDDDIVVEETSSTGQITPSRDSTTTNSATTADSSTPAAKPPPKDATSAPKEGSTERESDAKQPKTTASAEKKSPGSNTDTRPKTRAGATHTKPSKSDSKSSRRHESSDSDKAGTSTTTSDLLVKAHEKFNNGEFSAAEILYKRALKQSPSSMKALLGLETVYFETGQYAKSEKLLKKAVRRHSSARLWYRLGVVSRKLGKIQEAKKAYRHALKVSPNYSPAIKALEALGETP